MTKNNTANLPKYLVKVGEFVDFEKESYEASRAAAAVIKKYKKWNLITVSHIARTTSHQRKAIQNGFDNPFSRDGTIIFFGLRQTLVQLCELRDDLRTAIDHEQMNKAWEIISEIMRLRIFHLTDTETKYKRLKFKREVLAQYLYRFKQSKAGKCVVPSGKCAEPFCELVGAVCEDLDKMVGGVILQP